MYKGKLEKIDKIKNQELQNNTAASNTFEGMFIRLPEEGESFMLVNKELEIIIKTSKVQNIIEIDWDYYIFIILNSKYKLTYELI